MARVRAELKEGKSYSFRTGPSFVRGTPQTLTDPKQIEMVRNCGFFTVTDLEAEEAAHKAEMEATAKANAGKEAPAAGGKPPKSRARRSRGS